MYISRLIPSITYYLGGEAKGGLAEVVDGVEIYTWDLEKKERNKEKKWNRNKESNTHYHMRLYPTLATVRNHPQHHTQT